MSKFPAFALATYLVEDPDNAQNSGGVSSGVDTARRLHVSNIPFRYRETDLKDMFSVIVSNIPS